MRHARLKPSETDTYMHVYNRTVGSSIEFPFGRAEKEAFVRRLRKICQLYVLEVLAYQVMGNHFHILLFAPAERPSNEEAARRYEQYHEGRRKMDPSSPKCAELAAKLRDVSEFMKDLEQPFTRWFNRTRLVRRRGHLWADRFKNTVLEGGLSVWRCWKYIEMNPVRASMVSNPADYRFCSFGHWAATGQHPFQETIRRRFLPWFQGIRPDADLADINAELRSEFARIRAVESQTAPAEMKTALATAAEKEPFSTCLDRRVRYWVDGHVIGSELFVRNTIATARGQAALARRRLTRARSADGTPADLFCFKQLRVLVD